MKEPGKKTYRKIELLPRNKREKRTMIGPKDSGLLRWICHQVLLGHQFGNLFTDGYTESSRVSEGTRRTLG